MNRIFLLTFCCYGSIAYSQKSYPTELQLIEVLTKNTEQVGGVYKSTTWFTSATDSSYQKADTLIFYNDHIYLLEKQFCQYVNWSFYTKDAFLIRPVQHCHEPVTTTKNEDDDPLPYTFKVTEIQQRLFMLVFNEDKLVDKFEILSLTKQSLRNMNNEAADVLAIRRVKLDEPIH